MPQDIELRRERGHLHDLLHALGEDIAAERFHAALDLHVNIATNRRLEFEDVVLAMLFFAGDQFEIDLGRFLQQLFGNFLRVTPWIRSVALFFLRLGVVNRQ